MSVSSAIGGWREPGQGLDPASWLLALAVLVWAVSPHALFDGPVVLGLGATTLLNGAVLALLVPAAWVHGLRWRAAPVLAAWTWILLASFLLATPEPRLSTLQPFKSWAALVLAPFLFQLRQPVALRRILYAAIPWLAPVCVVAGLAVWSAIGWEWLYREHTGALRLGGLTYPAHLGLLGLVGLMACLDPRSRPEPGRTGGRRPALALLVFAVVVWTGGRVATACALLLFAPFFLEALVGAWRARSLRSLVPALLVALGLLAVAASYAPQALRRMGVTLVAVEPAPEGPALVEPPPAPPDPGATEAADRVAPEPAPAAPPAPSPPPIQPAPASDYELRLQMNDSGRRGAWEAYLERARGNRWFGRGLGAATIPVNAYYEAPHNELLRLLLEGGLVGLVLGGLAYAWVLAGAARRAPRAARLHLLGCVGVFALLCVVENPISAQVFAVPFWAYLAASQPPETASPTA